MFVVLLEKYILYIGFVEHSYSFNLKKDQQNICALLNHNSGQWSFE